MGDAKPPSRRGQVANLLDRLGVFDAVLAVRARTRSAWLPVLTYHRIGAPDASIFDDGVIDATPAEFDWQLATIRRHFTPIGVDELVAHFAGEAALPRNPVVVTFDDGYRDCHDVALPMLRRHDVKAIFFVATRYVSERRMFWWDRISYLMKRCGQDTITVSYPEPLSLDLNALLRMVKDRKELDLERFLDEVTRATGVPWTRELERGFAERMIMTWDHVRALRDAGMDVESHTQSHRVLHTLRADEVMRELTASRADLERELGRPVRAVSYPCGKAIDHSPQISNAVRDAGYSLGFSNAGGINALGGRLDPLHLRRVSLETDFRKSLFRGMMAIPYLAP